LATPYGNVAVQDFAADIVTAHVVPAAQPQSPLHVALAPAVNVTT